MPFDLTSLLQDPNFLQYMGNAGQAISQGKGAGEALNPAGIIQSNQSQKATDELLSRLLAGGSDQGVNSAVQQPSLEQVLSNSGQVPSQNATAYNAGGGEDMQRLMQIMQGTEPTPINQAGPNSRVIKQTEDGTTVTTTMPSSRNLNTFGANVPPEAQVAQQPQGGGTVPFFRALLG